MKQASIYYLVFTILTTTSSCNHYIDKATSAPTKIEDGTFFFLPDSNVLRYKSHVIIKLDTERQIPKSFSIALPKGLVGYSMANSQDFEFYYKNNQVIAFAIDLRNNIINHDTTFTPDRVQMNEIINHYFSGNGKYDITKIEYKSGKNQTVLQKGAVTFVLYNIEPSNYTAFVKSLISFQFL
jgi:hypothetical protein